MVARRVSLSSGGTEPWSSSPRGAGHGVARRCVQPGGLHVAARNGEDAPRR